MPDSEFPDFPRMQPRRPFFIVRGREPAGDDLKHPVVAIGNFDGLHAGHRAVVAGARRLADELGRPAAVLTFDPHPRTFFRPREPVFRLTPESVEATLLARLGLDGMIVLPFDAQLAAMSADAFFDDILVARFGVSGLIIGHDFHFGRGREGSPSFLLRRGASSGMPVVVVEPVNDGGEPVSSSMVRQALEAGDLHRANTLLGYRWFVRGDVSHGQKLGRTLNYPTANLRLDEGCRLRHGIYAVRAAVDSRVVHGVASFGHRPTFDNGAPLLEVHLFDFSSEIYGQQLDVEFVAYLRPEERFDSVEALVAQMDLDSAEARRILAENPPPRSLLG
ncbi:bifunctional riboflavin kinase/FAD synthetase [Chelatococcus reniformis]|uniref:Riboflavin biosynthesis protein n=1 Tax=Chelatococcus reniformis TaxID=1494448 RepID=A0A916UBV1_9HYPH|nr:bifunctional riboflavin kinase/FAD synthetase [Chelatococcus reniformis]GGC67325.1 riboflavin biosynthesis protein RibF [Chelatococcus reniformis]